MLAALRAVPKTHPFKFGVAFSTLKTSLADWLVQKYVEKREKIDWRRNSAFTLFGCFYLGGVQYVIYVPIFARMFPQAVSFTTKTISQKLTDFAGQRSVVAQVFLDQFVHHPLMYFPVFYALKEVVNGGSVEGGISQYATNYQEDLVALWKLWVPSMVVNFSLMPMWGRIPWVASTSLLWTMILSYMRGCQDSFETDPSLSEDISGNQGRAIMRQRLVKRSSANTMPAEYFDRTKPHMLLSVAGRDRIGYVTQLSSAVRRNRGNVLDARMFKFGGEFVAIMLVATDPGAEPMLIECLSHLPDMQVSVQRVRPWETAQGSTPAGNDDAVFQAQLHAFGPDQAGLIERVSDVLALHKVDINFLSCMQETSAQSDGSLSHGFSISGHLRAFEPVNEEALLKQIGCVEAETGMRVKIVHGSREVQQQ
jgi:glycine cleavage system regulatory protein|tara:strand:- start:510 stop:1778 length:1269 start_codon:yes stop_codon:yes gene_type:complete